MFGFLFGVITGAAGYWVWKSFGQDLLGMGGDQGSTQYTGSYGTPSGSTYSGSGASSGASAPAPSGGSATSTTPPASQEQGGTATSSGGGSPSA